MEDSQLYYIIFMIVFCTVILAVFLKNNLDKNYRNLEWLITRLRSDVDEILKKEGIDLYPERYMKSKGLTDPDAETMREAYLHQRGTLEEEKE